MQYLEDMDDTGIIDNPDQVKFISGGAKGTDVLGEQFAYAWGYDVIRFPPDEDADSISAGHTRNEEMIEFAFENGNIGVLIILG